MKLSIVLPVLNEEARLGRRLEELRSADEVVVVDGGSADGTRAIALAAPGVRLVDAPRGRAAQMNAGARASTGDALLFLHADCTLPPDAQAHVARLLAQPGVVAGAFRTWHEAEQGRTPLWLHLADLRSRYSRLPYGDQGLFVLRATFDAVGGFPEQPLFEDLELSRRLTRRGRIALAPARVRVSGRRFLRAPLRSALVVNTFPLLYRLGVSARALSKLYEEIR